MTLLPTSLTDAKLLELRSFRDDRGRFFEAWNLSRYRDAGIDLDFVQSNISVSHRGVLRGLHAQNPTPQGKLVTVLNGAVWDAIVDARPGSPTYLQWEGFELSADNRRQLWVPPGYLHGFISLAADTLVNYLVTAPYDPVGDFSVAWNDPDLGIQWPDLGEPSLSPKDAVAKRFGEIDPIRWINY